MKKNSTRGATLLLSVAAVLLGSVQASAQDRQRQRQPLPPPGDPKAVEIVASLWCDTAAQLESVLNSHYMKKVPMAEALAEVNKDSPEACIMARAIVNQGPEIKRLTAGDNVMSLRSANVLGVMQGQYALMMRPQTWYFVRIVAELTPL